MLVEELRLRKGSLAAAGYLTLTEQEVSGWQLSTTIYYISGQIVGKDAQWIDKFSGQVSQLDAPGFISVGRLPSWLPDEPRKEGILKKEKKK